MKHTRGIDVDRAGEVAEVLAAQDNAGLVQPIRLYLKALIERADAYRAADEACAAATADLTPGDPGFATAQAARIEALRAATREHDTVLAGIVAAHKA